MKHINISTAKQREYFLGAYESWEHVHTDEFNGFEYYQYEFKNGDRFIALKYKTDYATGKAVLITLVKDGSSYMPIATLKTRLLGYLEVLSVELRKEELNDKYQINQAND